MLIAILALWRAAPDYYITNVEQSMDPDRWQALSVRMRTSDADTAVKISAASSFQHFTDIFFRMQPNDPYYEMCEFWMKSSLLV
jgi:neurofibromin 1